MNPPTNQVPPVAVAEPVFDSPETVQPEFQKAQKQSRRCTPATVCCGTCSLVGIAIAIAVTVSLLSSSPYVVVDPPPLEVSQNEAPSSPPTVRGDPECAMKRVRITEICGLPDLDDDAFGNDKAMELKVLINDLPYWPQRPERDCLEAYGASGGDACIIPDSSLTGCFALQNSIEVAFTEENVDEAVKVTIYDKDFFADDILDILAPTVEWFRPNKCEKTTHEFSSEEGGSVKMVVDFGEVENLCGVDDVQILTGLDDASSELQNVQLALAEYGKGVAQERVRRRLIFSLLASGFRVLGRGVASFVGRFTPSRRGASDALSTVADLTQIGSLLYSQQQSNSPSVDGLLDDVFERFDEIDNQLDEIDGQIKSGFEQIQLVIKEAFAKQELDEYVTFRLGVDLRSSYDAYLARDISTPTRERYEGQFREVCTGDYSPYNIFQVLYSHACKECDRFGGRSQQYFLSTYVDIAKANFEADMDRVLWFRRSFGTVVVGSLTELIFFHSVCLYRDHDECDMPDPVWDRRLEEMGYALEEVVESLGEAETRIEQ